jgi:hypothetical protein
MIETRLFFSISFLFCFRVFAIFLLRKHTDSHSSPTLSLSLVRSLFLCPCSHIYYSIQICYIDGDMSDLNVNTNNMNKSLFLSLVDIVTFLLELIVHEHLIKNSTRQHHDESRTINGNPLTSIPIDIQQWQATTTDI